MTLGKKRKIQTLSLFSGAGGLDIGFHDAGFEIVACVEIEPDYCKTLSANSGRDRYLGAATKVNCVDIREFDVRPFVDNGIECVIGGPPCQTFSAAGRRAGGVIGTRDERGRLFETYRDILAKVRPRAFIFENVYGITGANGGAPWRAIVQAFSELGYTLRTEVLDAADYGVPQHRERLFIVGTREGQFEFPLPTHGPDSPSGAPLVSVSEAIQDLQVADEPFHGGVGGLYGHLLPLVPEGLNYAFFTAEMGHPEPQFAWRSKFHDLLYKVDRSRPCRTIKAQPGKFTGPFHWKNRHFTAAELKRLQTFPDEYEIVGNLPKVLHQIGNSVPPRLAFVLATSLRDQVFERKGIPTFAVRSLGFNSTFRQRQRERTNEFKAIAAAAIASRYGAAAKEIVVAQKRRAESYFLLAESFFHRRRASKAQSVAKSAHAFSVRVVDSGDALSINVTGLKAQSDSFHVEINVAGLQKYLGRIERVRVHAELQCAEDLFYTWSVVEEALVERSRFFTLIDIYGHYANRGDTIKIATSFDGPPLGSLSAGLSFFSQSENCGDILHVNEVRRYLGLSERGLSRFVNALRALRFDIRTAESHPILRSGDIICTYPFPLLSQRAMVESKAQLTVREPSLLEA